MVSSYQYDKDQAVDAVVDVVDGRPLDLRVCNFAIYRASSGEILASVSLSPVRS